MDLLRATTLENRMALVQPNKSENILQHGFLFVAKYCQAEVEKKIPGIQLLSGISYFRFSGFLKFVHFVHRQCYVTRSWSTSNLP